MKKKQYMQPQTEVVEIKASAQLLAGSPAGSQVYDEDADENEYGL